ncbi:MAG: alpha/beta hydrolase-fold protein, partial [Saprospiraceae bacterium]|nr:alpha/beta hydrolase-fold protein [Saprospiraceae bacterium]
MNRRRLCLFLLVAGMPVMLLAAWTDTLKVYSQTMQRELVHTVIVPGSYATSARQYPVLYLLHGAGGDHRNWIEKAAIILSLADQHQMIIVCPD